MPSAADSAVPAWPAPKLSCSLSVRSAKPFRPSGLADGAEAFFAAGQKLVDINLMAHVPDKFILRRGENLVQRDGQLDDAEVRAEVAAAFGEALDQLGADFAGELLQLRHRELFDVLRSVHHVQVSAHNSLNRASRVSSGKSSASMASTMPSSFLRASSNGTPPLAASPALAGFDMGKK
jgi:hypothetical protein